MWADVIGKMTLEMEMRGQYQFKKTRISCRCYDMETTSGGERSLLEKFKRTWIY